MGRYLTACHLGQSFVCDLEEKVDSELVFPL